MMLTRSGLQAGRAASCERHANARNTRNDDVSPKMFCVCPGFCFSLQRLLLLLLPGYLFLSSRLFRHNKLAARPEWEKFTIISTKGIELTITQTRKNRSHRHSRTGRITQGRIAAKERFPAPARLAPRRCFCRCLCEARHIVGLHFLPCAALFTVRSSRNAPANPEKFT